LGDKALFELGQKAVAAIGGSGLVDLDVIRRCKDRDCEKDSDGEEVSDWVIDVNLRAWHSLGALLDAGVDFVQGYLGVIGVLSGAPHGRRAEPGVELRLSLLLSRESTGWTPLSAISWFLAASWHRIRTFGIRYWVSELLTHASGSFGVQKDKNKRSYS
jgi:hypothetical protein